MTVVTPRTSRARIESEEKLIVAAADLVGEVGPRSMSVRALADRAGVNHGLVHHYFGGKDGLLRAAMMRLVEEHAQFAKEKSGGSPIPAPLALATANSLVRRKKKRRGPSPATCPRPSPGRWRPKARWSLSATAPGATLSPPPATPCARKGCRSADRS